MPGFSFIRRSSAPPAAPPRWIVTPGIAMSRFAEKTDLLSVSCQPLGTSIARLTGHVWCQGFGLLLIAGEGNETRTTRLYLDRTDDRGCDHRYFGGDSNPRLSGLHHPIESAGAGNRGGRSKGFLSGAHPTNAPTF